MGHIGFELKTLEDGLLFNAELTMYPTVAHAYDKKNSHSKAEFKEVTSNYFGFVISGELYLKRQDSLATPLTEKMYFSATGPFEIQGEGKCFIIERKGYRGTYMAGGPIESTGRLCYIDNCSVNQLVPPLRAGDPTLQALYFPKETKQTMHIHPTIRIGYVVSGEGKCITGAGDSIDLAPGKAFYLQERFPHCFHSGKEDLVVIAYHPESDVGPTDQVHPMLSRTYIAK